jgi:hypothetical protein
VVVVVDEAVRGAVIKGEHEAFAVHDRRVDDGVVRQLDETRLGNWGRCRVGPPFA